MLTSHSYVPIFGNEDGVPMFSSTSRCFNALPALQGPKGQFIQEMNRLIGPNLVLRYLKIDGTKQQVFVWIEPTSSAWSGSTNKGDLRALCKDLSGFLTAWSHRYREDQGSDPVPQLFRSWLSAKFPPPRTANIHRLVPNLYTATNTSTQLVRREVPTTSRGGSHLARGGGTNQFVRRPAPSTNQEASTIPWNNSRDYDFSDEESMYRQQATSRPGVPKNRGEQTTNLGRDYVKDVLSKDKQVPFLCFTHELH